MQKQETSYQSSNERLKYGFVDVLRYIECVGAMTELALDAVAWSLRVERIRATWRLNEKDIIRTRMRAGVFISNSGSQRMLPMLNVIQFTISLKFLK